jgi:hypothetical protein
MRAGNSYALISPCRDEAEYMRQTLDSVVRQSIRPAKWIIATTARRYDAEDPGEYCAKHGGSPS